MASKPAVLSFFQPKSTKEGTQAAAVPEYTLPSSEDPVISAYYAQLTANETIAHAIAVEKLGTSYDVTRTHGFLKWKKKQTPTH